MVSSSTPSAETGSTVCEGGEGRGRGGRVICDKPCIQMQSVPKPTDCKPHHSQGCETLPCYVPSSQKCYMYTPYWISLHLINTWLHIHICIWNRPQVIVVAKCRQTCGATCKQRTMYCHMKAATFGPAIFLNIFLTSLRT